MILLYRKMMIFNLLITPCAGRCGVAKNGRVINKKNGKYFIYLFLKIIKNIAKHF